MNTEVKICQECGREFVALTKKVKSGGAKCCSRKCTVITLNKARNAMWSVNVSGLNTGNGLQDTSCPFSIERLRELYWKQGMSLRQIAALATESIERKKPFDKSTVSQWLRKANISPRTISEVRKLYLQQHPKAAQEWSAAINASRHARKGSITVKPKSFYRKIGAKGNKARSKNAKERTVRVPCSNSGCNNIVSRPLHYALQRKRMYCSNSCRSLHMKQLNREAKEQEKLRKQAEELFGKIR